MNCVIALHGAKGSGKDLFFLLAKDLFPDFDLRKIAFADPIKDKVCEIFRLDNESEYDIFKRGVIDKSCGQSVEGREIVRGIGMLMRSYNPNQFVEYVSEKIKTSDCNIIWFITDLRFDNEVRYIKQAGGCIIKIKRPTILYDGHPTETQLDDKICDIIIENSGTIEQYKQTVSKIVQQTILERKIDL